MRYRPPRTSADVQLRAKVNADIVSWDIGLSADYIDMLTEASSAMAESCYAHISSAHKLVIALHSAYLNYIDDLGGSTGFAEEYALFNFVDGWPDPADNVHMRVIPLSFYKESLDGETTNYISMRAVAERKDPLDVLRELSAETLESMARIELLTSSDPQLAHICSSHITGFVEFHFRAERYRLGDLGFDL
ncbi:hypothetical protein BV20DRAFT_1055214 [Pilatotrama ljubarskyi]|nr:hypothetical protein BV20DRAFT_1055214 [Pilatotrama ljubarskyi]